MKFENAVNESHIYFYESIEQGCSKTFIEQLQAIPENTPIVLHINSAGGSVFDGLAIYENLRQRKNVTVKIEGLAASIASVIAMSGLKIQMSESALIMIHNPFASTSGNAEQLRQTAGVLEKIRQQIIKIYQSRLKMSEQKIADLMSNETWFDATEALKIGFIDEIIQSERLAAHFDFETLSKFKNLPKKLLKLRGNKQMENGMKQEDLKTEWLAQETNRRDTIKKLFDGHEREHFELLNKCVNDPACTEQHAMRLLLKASCGSTSIAGGSTFQSGDNGREFSAAATDALLIKNGIRVASPHPGSRDVLAMSVADVAAQCLRLAGRSTAGMSKAQIINAALTTRNSWSASHSTSDFPAILANTAGKALAIGYGTEPVTHKIWTGEREVSDFKPQTLARLSEAPSLEQIDELGEYTYGSFSDNQETFQPLTYGRIFSISRQSLVNDDLNSFVDLPRAFGQASARKECDLLYSLLLANPTMSDGVQFLHSSHNNLLGTGTALSVASLGLARAAMRKQKGLGGLSYIDPQPKFLLVPVALQTTAETLVASLVKPGATNGEVNSEFIRNLTVVSDPRLDSSSATAWYLIADSAQIQSFIRVYLLGEARPFYEEEGNFNTDSMSVKSRLDFCAAAIDWKGMYKNLGA